MLQLRRDDVGNSGATFYQVTLQPSHWYKWFGTSKDIDEKPEKDGDSGWTEVVLVYQMQLSYIPFTYILMQPHPAWIPDKD